MRADDRRGARRGGRAAGDLSGAHCEWEARYPATSSARWRGSFRAPRSRSMGARATVGPVGDLPEPLRLVRRGGRWLVDG